MIIFDLLETLGLPVYRQGSMHEHKKYPDTFFTVWNFDTPEDRHFDNEASRAVWGWWVYCYSNDIDLVYEKLEEARKLLKEHGFSIEGKGTDVQSDHESHVGRMITVYIVENY